MEININYDLGEKSEKNFNKYDTALIEIVNADTIDSG